MKFVPGDVVKQTNGTPFPDGHHFALIRRAGRGEPAERVGGVYLKGGQWVYAHSIQHVGASELLEPMLRALEYERKARATVAELQAELEKVKDASQLKKALDGEVGRRRRAEKKAAVANNELEPMRAKVRTLEKEIKKFALTEHAYRISSLNNAIAVEKLAQIKLVLAEDGSMWE